MNNDSITSISTRINDSLSSSSTMIPYNNTQISYNILQDDELIKLIKEKFNDSDMEIFNLNFNIYLANENNKNGYIINLDDIYRWIGFEQKCHAKRLLINKFEINIHYEIINDHTKLLSRSGERDVNKGKSAALAGENKEIILLTVECFKLLCFESQTDKSKKIRNYYITIETIAFDYIKTKMKEQLHMLKLKDKQLELQATELSNIKNQKYEEIKKTEYVYILTTDKDDVYKIGKSINTKQRISSLQTGCVDEVIEIGKYKTSSNRILESIVHHILQRYKCNTDREHFRCNISYIKTIINISSIFLDTLKSTYEYITNNELLEKLHDKLKHDFIINNNKQFDTLQVIDNNPSNIIETFKPIQNEINNTSTIKDYTQLYTWILKNYIKTENSKDTIKLSDLYKDFQININFNTLSKLKKRELNYKRFKDELEKCSPLKKYLKQDSHKVYIITNFKKIELTEANLLKIIDSK